jgi:hypothetical protein
MIIYRHRDDEDGCPRDSLFKKHSAQNALDERREEKEEENE